MPPDFAIERNQVFHSRLQDGTIIARTVQRQWFSACSSIFKAFNKGLWQIIRSVRVNVSIYEVRGRANSLSSVSPFAFPLSHTLSFSLLHTRTHTTLFLSRASPIIVAGFRKPLINFRNTLLVHVNDKLRETPSCFQILVVVYISSLKHILCYYISAIIKR